MQFYFYFSSLEPDVITFQLQGFLKCYLAAPQPTFGHSQENSVTNPTLINVLFLSTLTQRSLGTL